MSEPAHVQQARNELANARRLGNRDSERSALKRLAAAGVEPEAAPAEPDTSAARDDEETAVEDPQAEDRSVKEAAQARAAAGTETRSRPAGRRSPRASQA